VFGLNSTGFKRKEYNDIVESMRTRARDTFGDEVKLTNDSFLGMLITVLAWTASILWQLAEKVYYSRFVKYAEGENLSIAAENGGTKRRPAEKAKGTATFTGTGIVPQGFLLSAGDILFQTTEEGLTGEEIPIEALEGGKDGNLPLGLIDNIVNPLPNIDGFTATETTGGRDLETDPELRTRYFASLGGSGASTVNSIVAELLRTESVRAASVFEEIDSGFVVGIRTVVLDGLPEDIAQSILNKKAHGIKTFGAESALATAINGQTVNINFDYASEIPIYINVELVKGNAYPVDGDSQVKKVLAQYIGGSDAEGNLYAGLSMNQDVVYSKIISEIFKINGVESVDVEVSTDNTTFVKENIPIGLVEVAETSADKVVIV
jgi:uncharacterized phage protein gp47/JayE